jgi:pimeloyl-ACP methyl ester carboxylesterase
MTRLLIALAVLAAGAFAVPALAADIGIVFMHGKWGTTGAQSPIGPMVSAMQRAGYLVDTPEMPWSRDRAYDKDVEGAFGEIDTAVERLKGKGAQRIVVGGQSLGANVALAYAAARGEGLAGVIVVAPGHTPEIESFRAGAASEVARARDLIKNGKGGDKIRFSDNNQGKKGTVGARPSDYLTWFDPDGALVFPKSAAALKPGTPLLWVLGKEDSMAQRGEAYAFAKAPPNPKSLYKVFGGGHFDTPTVAAAEINAWLKGL